MPSAQSCEPVGNSKPFGSGGLARTHCLLVSSQGTCNVTRNTSANSVAGAGLVSISRLRTGTEKLSWKLAERCIHTFKHCLCLNPTHLGTRGQDCQLGSVNQLYFLDPFMAYAQMPVDEYMGSSFPSSVVFQWS